VTATFGGLKTFLPLLDQVDYDVPHEDNNLATSFLASVITFFGLCFKWREDIETNFVQGGFLYIAHCLVTVKQETVQAPVIAALVDIHSNLKRPETRLNMLSHIWLNLPMWQKQSAEVRKEIIERGILPLFETVDFNRVKRVMSSMLTAFVIMLIREPSLEVRKLMWSVLVKLRAGFSIGDLAVLYSAAILGPNVEGLKRLHDSYRANKAIFPPRVQQTREFYNDFLTLFSSTDEAVRKWSLKLIVQVFTLQDTNCLGPSPNNQSFGSILLSGVHVFNPANGTESYWELLREYFTKDIWMKVRSHLFPLLAYASQFQAPELVTEILTILKQSADAIADCRLWFFWLFFMAQAMHRPTFDPDKCPQDIFDLFALCAISLAKRDRASDITDFLAFFQLMMIKKKWNLTRLVRNILIRLCEMATLEKTIVIVSREVMVFLFYVSSVEPYARNIELHTRHRKEYEWSLHNVFPGNVTLEDFRQLWEETPTPYEFSMRVLPDGRWQDVELAMAFVRLLKRAKVTKPGIPFAKIKNLRYIEIAGFVLGQVVRSDANLIDECLSIADKFLNASDTLPFVLFIVPFSYVNETKYASFLTANPLVAKILGKAGQNPPITGAWGEEISQFYAVLVDQCEDVKSRWNQRMASFWKELFGQFALLTNRNIDPSLSQVYEEGVQNFDWTIRQKLAQTEKYYKKISRDLKRKAGPWYKNQETQYSKIWSITDSMFRRVFMKPNYSYDRHKLASLKRDESTAAEADLKFQKWRAEFGVESEGQDQYKEENEVSDITANGFAADVNLVKLHKQYPGRLCMNDDDIMFNSSENTKAIQFSQSDIEMVLHRSVLHLDSGLEFFLTSKRSYFFYYEKLQDRTKMLQILKKKLSKDVLIQIGLSASMIPPFTDRWRQGLLSNYEYLIYVNLIGGRSFNDLSQYPVFPWVSCDYTSDTLDISDGNNYRNLAKPIGTLNKERLMEAIAKYEMSDDGDINKCHYRMHYSNPYYVVLYLVRLEPYTTVHIDINDGKFDKPNRLFWSIERTWRSVTSRAPDFRELIPEFFTLPDFLLNANDFDLGPNEGSPHGHVILPPWAKGSPHLFIDIHRQALESEYVSKNLCQWIDLIFGFRQNGPEAIVCIIFFCLFRIRRYSRLPRPLTLNLCNKSDTRQRRSAQFLVSCGLILRIPSGTRFVGRRSFRRMESNFCRSCRLSQDICTSIGTVCTSSAVTAVSSQFRSRKCGRTSNPRLCRWGRWTII
jgi:hypothetical protein